MGGWEPLTGWELEVPHKLMLRGYAVTRLRVWYCINKCTRILGPQNRLIFYLVIP